MKNLEGIAREVDSMRDRQDRPVEKKIRELLIGLRRCGIETEASCEGHLDHGFPYPWVDILPISLHMLLRVVAWQNRPGLPGGLVNTNTWVIRPGGVIRLIPEDKNLPLEKLQDMAVEFGLFLQRLPDEWFSYPRRLVLLMKGMLV